MFKKLSGKEFYSSFSPEGEKKTPDLTKVCDYCGLYLSGGSYIVYMGAYFCNDKCFDLTMQLSTEEDFIEYDN